MNLIDRDALPKGRVEWEDIAEAPTVDAIPTEWIDQFGDKHRGYISRVTITWLVTEWEEEQRGQNEKT